MLEIPLLIFLGNLDSSELSLTVQTKSSCLQTLLILDLEGYLISAILLPPLPMTHPMISFGTVIS